MAASLKTKAARSQTRKKGAKSAPEGGGHVRFGPCRSRTALIRKSLWRHLPPWVALYAERGKVHKCWEGHRLRREHQDGRIHRACVWCERHAESKAPVLCCRACRWTVCGACEERPRLPTLEADPLFWGPKQPMLLEPPCGFDDATARSRGTVIICPGGNYEFLVPAEGMPAAELLARAGIRAFVLRYRLLPAHDLQDMLADLDAAVKLARSTYGGPVAAMGFSAGGHLTASLSLRTTTSSSSTSSSSSKARGGKKSLDACRPLDAQVLVYPCIDASDWANPDDCGFNNWEECYPVAKKSMVEGREALLGGPGFAAPPTFMVASTVDEASPPKDHTDPYARALRRHGIACTYMRRDYGAHGFALSGGWTDRCIAWLREQGFGANVGGK